MPNDQYVLASTTSEPRQQYTGTKRHLQPRWLGIIILIAAVIIAIGLAVGLAVGLQGRGHGATDEEHGKKHTEDNHDADPDSINSRLGKYRYAAVAADATICSQIGSNILGRKKGSAVDAAIATLFCMGAANAHSMGIGGGFFATIFDSKTGQVSVLDAREEAPGSATVNMYGGDKTKSLFGGLAIAVPGELKGYWEMYRKFGTLPWRDLVQPTIDLCEQGFPLTPALNRSFDSLRKRNMFTGRVKDMFTDPNTGKVLGEGDIMKLPELARTLREVATDGANTFYNGSLADKIVQDIQEAGGIITKNDLLNYQAKWKTPVKVTLDDGLTVYSLPAPSSGGVLSLILNILEGYKMNNKSVSNLENTVMTYHRIAEAMKFAYAMRSNLGDSDFVDVSQLEANMTSREYGETLRNLISDDQTYDASYYGGTFHDTVKPGTAHLSLTDSDGNSVSVTSTINLYFGSGVIGSRTGIIFNDEMDDFSSPNVTNVFGIEPSTANFIEPGKRPLSSMCPAIILDQSGAVKMVTGAAGGSKITTATALVILRSLRFGQDLKTATDAPRFHHQLLPPVLQVEENRFDKEILDGLKKKGHELRNTNPRGSVVQSVLVDKNSLVAVSDDRKSAQADGF